MILAIVGVSVFGMLLVIGIQFRKLSRQRERRNAALHALPPTSIDGLVPGTRVRVVGRAVGSDHVKAPYSGKACLAFHGERSAVLDRGSGQYAGARVTYQGPTSEEIRAFAVDDGTGTVAVTVDHATLELAPNAVSRHDIDEHVFGARMLARETTSQSYWECILEPDERVAVIGTVVKGDNGSLRLAGTPEQPLVVSNLQAALEP